MSTGVLPVRSDTPAYQFRTDLNGSEYVFDFSFNARDDHWYFDLSDADLSPIVQGVRVVCNWPLLFYVTDPRCPYGEIYAIDTTGQDQDPGRDDLGARVVMTYQI